MLARFVMRLADLDGLLLEDVLLRGMDGFVSSIGGDGRVLLPIVEVLQ